MSDLTTTGRTLGLSKWFSLVEDPEVAASILASTTTTTYTPSPFRECNTGKSPFFSWGVPVQNKDRNVNTIPEINDPIVGVRGHILHYGTRLSLYDSEAKKQLCSSVSSVIGYTSDQQPIVNKNTYPITTPIYNGRGYSNPGEPAIPNTITENLKVMGSRGLSCLECVLRGEDEVTNIPETGPSAGKEVTFKCGASNKIIFCVLEFAIIEVNDQNKNVVVWYRPQDYLSRKGTPVIAKPFILEMNLGRAQATKKIGSKFAIVTEPHSSVPGDTVTWITYLNNLNNVNNRKINIVKAIDPTAFGCDYMFLVKTATEIWCGNATKEYENQMISGWPVFKDWELKNKGELNDIIETSFLTYNEEKSSSKDSSLEFFTPEDTKLAAATTTPKETKQLSEDTTTAKEPEFNSIQTRTSVTDAVDIFRR